MRSQGNAISNMEAEIFHSYALDAPVFATLSLVSRSDDPRKEVAEIRNFRRFFAVWQSPEDELLTAADPPTLSCIAKSMEVWFWNNGIMAELGSSPVITGKKKKGWGHHGGMSSAAEQHSSSKHRGHSSTLEEQHGGSRDIAADMMTS